MNDKTGGPAFPNNAHTLPVEQGMTLRDYMAIHANDSDVQDVLNRHRTTCDYAGPLLRYEFIVCDQPFTITRQQARYMHADEMLLERAK